MAQTFPNCKYSYSHRAQKGQAIQIHDISIARNRLLVLLSYFGTLSLLTIFFYLLLMKKEPDMSYFWSIFLVFMFANKLHYKPVIKESVMIMQGFGVQLETHYWSGGITRRFIPIGKIMKPVLNECVTPVTCYWSLTLILCEENAPVLVFQELRPPLQMLVPVWSALRSTTDRDATKSSSCS